MKEELEAVIKAIRQLEKTLWPFQECRDLAGLDLAYKLSGLGQSAKKALDEHNKRNKGAQP